MASPWLETLKSAQKTCLVQDGRRKIHYTFKEDCEMVEEYDLRNDELLVRKWKKPDQLGGTGKWEFEVGESLKPAAAALENEGLMESSCNPIFVRKDTKKAFQWRIRNLPYPLKVYDVKVDMESRVIIVKTTNKKYYKKFFIADLDRCKLPLMQSSLSFAHAHNTLIISYEKPSEILSQERLLQEELKKTKACKDGEVDSCSPS